MKILSKIKKVTTGGVFQLYIYNHSFCLSNGSKIVGYEIFSKITVQTLLNELFLLDRNNNQSAKKNTYKRIMQNLIMHNLLMLNKRLSNIYLVLISLCRT